MGPTTDRLFRQNLKTKTAAFISIRAPVFIDLATVLFTTCHWLSRCNHSPKSDDCSLDATAEEYDDDDHRLLRKLAAEE